jgi:hypothetical protein
VLGVQFSVPVTSSSRAENRGNHRIHPTNVRHIMVKEEALDQKYITDKSVVIDLAL